MKIEASQMSLSKAIESVSGLLVKGCSSSVDPQLAYTSSNVLPESNFGLPNSEFF